MTNNEKERCCNRCYQYRTVDRITEEWCEDEKCPGCHQKNPTRTSVNREIVFEFPKIVQSPDISHEKPTSDQEVIEDWEEDLRLRVRFDRNQDREVCILFIKRLLHQHQEEVLEELRQTVPLGVDYMNWNLYIDEFLKGRSDPQT